MKRSVNETDLVAALIAKAPEDCLRSLNTLKGQLKQDGLPITVKEILKDMLDLYCIKKERNMKLNI